MTEKPSPSPAPSRRDFLRGSGAALALPALASMAPAFGRSAEPDGPAPRRMLAICSNLGILPGRFFPSEAGNDYALSPYLEELADFREDFSVLSGVSHPGVDGSHASDVSFLTAAPHPASGGFRNSISLDQHIASQVGHLTRFPSLTLGVNPKEGRRSLSWTNAGVLIPCEGKASEVFRKLFIQGTKDEVDRQLRRLALGQSIMDTVGEQSKRLQRRIAAEDRERLDQYFTAVRETEKRMELAGEWEQRPKPPAPGPVPEDPPERSAFMEKTRLMYRMAKLAFETDSTRSITLLLDGNNSPTIKVKGAQIRDGYHNLSHHGNNEDKLAQLEAIDRAHFTLLSELLADLKATPQGVDNLLRQTTILFGSNLGDANKHTTDNMPVLVAGGRFQHGRHLAFDPASNSPLSNLFLSVLQQMGIETQRFGTSTGPLRGLDWA